MKKSSSNKAIRRNWLSLIEAARILGTTATALRRKFERNVQRATDGVIEAIIDGVHGRKFGGRWKVALSENWTN